MTSSAPAEAAPTRWPLVMALYLLGIFMGAIDTGIVTPGRTVIQRDLGVHDQSGIWMITIYTLAYAAAIPIMGKLADRVGRKRIYLLSILLFGLGSLACGLSQDVGSFGMLIAARAVQAIGGGGILPIATAEIGTGVPAHKRGMALGLVGGVYGIANIFGASAGSAILDVAGAENWQWIFYVNVPIALAIIAVGVAVIPNHTSPVTKPIDILGSLVLVAMILSLLYGLRNLDFFDVARSMQSLDVWPFLAGFLVGIPVLILTERRAADPVLNLSYFTRRDVGLTLLLSLLSGVVLMAVVFVPQFAENALRIKSGAGGYTVIALGLASGIGAPLSGTLTDRFGPKAVLAVGAGVSAVAAAVVLWWTIPFPSVASVFVALGLFGLGLGFIVGSPLNYMMLSATPQSEANSALGSLSLVRAVGTTLAPAIMVGFLAQAGTLMQDRLIAQLPTTVAAPALPHAAELQAKLDDLKANPDLADQLKGVTFPDLTAQQTISVDPTGGGTLPDDLVELLKTADVTTIVDRTKQVASAMFRQETPARVAEIQAGVQSGLAGLSDADAQLAKAAADLARGLADMDAKLADMAKGLAEMDAQITTLDAKLAQLTQAISGLDQGMAGMKSGLSGLNSAVAGLDAGIAKQQAALATLKAKRATLTSGSPPALELDRQIAGVNASLAKLAQQRSSAIGQIVTLRKKLAAATAQRAQLVQARAGASEGRAGIADGRAKLAAGQAELTKARADLAKGQADVADAQSSLGLTRTQLTELRDGVPAAFDAALASYLADIDGRTPTIEATFQSTLAEGFRGVYVVYGVAALLMLGLLPLIPARRRREAAGDSGQVAASPPRHA